MQTRRTILKAVAAAPLMGSPAILRNARAAELSLKWGHPAPSNSPLHLRLQEACQNISTATNGRVEIRVFSDAQLGNDVSMLSQVRSGALDFYTTGGGSFSATDIRISALTLPFLFQGDKTLWPAVDGEFGEFLTKVVASKGMYVFRTLWSAGFRNITSSKEPVRSAADMKGLKIRVPSSPMSISVFTRLGAAPVVMGVSEVYLALQTKVADAQEHSLVTIYTAKFYEVQRYCSLTNHSTDCYIQVANAKLWAQLPKDIQTIIAQAVNDAGIKQRADMQKLDLETRALLEARGMQFVDNVDIGSFRSALGSFYEEWRGKLGADVWEVTSKYAAVPK